MKKSVLLLGLAVVVAVGIAVQLSTRDAVVGQVRSWERFATTRISDEFEIAAGAVQSVSFAAPSDALLDSLFKGSSGRFEVKVSAAGTHTFFFENAGVKQTPRHVLLDAEFKPH